MALEQPQQLTLQVSLKDNHTFENFLVVERNQLLMTALRTPQPDDPQLLYLYGASGAGKSHLLLAACHETDLRGGQALFLPMQQLLDQHPQSLLEQLESVDMICLDDVHLLAGQTAWEEALFHLYNRAVENGTSLLFAAQDSPRNLPVQLADLQSRLNAAVVYQLDALLDQEKVTLLTMRAAARGLTLSDETANYIVHRNSRNTVDLLELLDRLDKAALARQRKLTIPFVREVMSW